MQLNKWFTHVAEAVSHATGHALAFIICCVIVIVWAATGPIFGFSDTWQLIINTGTTIVGPRLEIFLDSKIEPESLRNLGPAAFASGLRLVRS